MVEVAAGPITEEVRGVELAVGPALAAGRALQPAELIHVALHARALLLLVDGSQPDQMLGGCDCGTSQAAPTPVP